VKATNRVASVARAVEDRRGDQTDTGGYQERPWPAVVALWAALNEQAAHVIGGIADDRLETRCRIGSGEPVTLEFIVRDYLRHLRHHLEQVVDPEAAAGKAHPPWGQPRRGAPACRRSGPRARAAG
jgi:hypothetical protein